MSESAITAGGMSWNVDGAGLGPSLSDKGAVVVIAADPGMAGDVALAIGRVESQRRRVAIADLVGELPVLHRYATGDDPHGISDSFNFGVSLNKIAYPVDGAGELFVMPSGSDAVQTEAIYRSPRWRRLASGFHEVGALLLLVAPAGAEGLDDLIASTDGAITVGDVALPAGAAVIARLTSPGTAVPTRPNRSERSAVPIGVERRTVPRTPGLPRWAALAAALLLAAGLGAGAWFWSRSGADSGDEAALAANEVSASGAVEHDAALADSAGAAAAGDSAAGTEGEPEVPPPVVVSNPADSAAAASWGVEIVATNTQSGAIFKLIEEAGILPSATYSPVSRGGERLWFYVVSGAYRERGAADSLLRALRANGTMARGAGQVRRLPYALLVQTGVSRENAPALVAAFVARELPVYALLQPDGSASLFAGAFEAPDQTGLLAASLRARGVEPRVVYRIGRTF